jgi:hypothetical protein
MCYKTKNTAGSMKDKIYKSISKVSTLYNIWCTIHFDRWSAKPELTNKRARGVYVIYDSQRVYYVGKGFIRDRQDKHREKFLGEFKNARDTRGFKKFREQYGILDLTSLDFCYITLDSETAISAVETGLIHLLQPLANDETQ